MEWKEFFVLALEHTSWPLVAVFFAIFFRGQLGSFLKLPIKKAKIGSAEVEMFDQQIPKRKIENISIADIGHLVPPKDVTGLREGIEKNISQFLEKEAANLTAKDRESLLVGHLANFQIANYFERVYNGIFGTQILLLDFLAFQPNKNSNTATLHPYLDASKSNNPESQIVEWDFSQYMYFLKVWHLVEQEGDIWTLTDTGAGFLAYIDSTGLSKNKTL